MQWSVTFFTTLNAALPFCGINKGAKAGKNGFDGVGTALALVCLVEKIS